MSESHSAYSNLKCFHHQEALEGLRSGKCLAPIRIQLIPTNRCNQACAGCAYRIKDYRSSQTFNDHDELSWSKLKGIVHDCKAMGVKAIELTGGGESALHPHFFDLCEGILDGGMDLALVTNGSIWSPQHTKILSRSHWVRFSIDAGCGDTYANYRHTTAATYDAVREHLRQLVGSDRRPDLLIGVGFVLNKDNWREAIKATQNAKQDGADNIRISALFQPQGWKYFRDFFNEARVLCQNAETLATDRFKVFNLFGDRLCDLHSANPDYSFCGYSKLTTYLAADGNAYTCCMNAYSKHGIIGSFKDQSFREMWDSPETRERLATLDARRCLCCMYNAKNKTIAYALKDNPLHVNFI